jgi:hypothetical protein
VTRTRRGKRPAARRTSELTDVSYQRVRRARAQPHACAHRRSLATPAARTPCSLASVRNPRRLCSAYTSTTTWPAPPQVWSSRRAAEACQGSALGGAVESLAGNIAEARARALAQIMRASALRCGATKISAAWLEEDRTAQTQRPAVAGLRHVHCFGARRNRAGAAAPASAQHGAGTAGQSWASVGAKLLLFLTRGGSHDGTGAELRRAQRAECGQDGRGGERGPVTCGQALG